MVNSKTLLIYILVWSFLLDLDRHNCYNFLHNIRHICKYYHLYPRFLYHHKYYSLQFHYMLDNHPNILPTLGTMDLVMSLVLLHLMNYSDSQKYYFALKSMSVCCCLNKP